MQLQNHLTRVWRPDLEEAGKTNLPANTNLVSQFEKVSEINFTQNKEKKVANPTNFVKGFNHLF